jgi:hypothetical protein
MIMPHTGTFLSDQFLTRRGYSEQPDGRTWVRRWRHFCPRPLVDHFSGLCSSCSRWLIALAFAGCTPRWYVHISFGPILARPMVSFIDSQFYTCIDSLEVHSFLYVAWVSSITNIVPRRAKASSLLAQLLRGLGAAFAAAGIQRSPVVPLPSPAITSIVKRRALARLLGVEASAMKDLSTQV